MNIYEKIFLSSFFRLPISVMSICYLICMQMANAESVEESSSSFSVVKQCDLLSVKANQVSQKVLLESIALEYDLIVAGAEQLNNLVSVEFEGLNLHEAMLRILRGNSYALRISIAPEYVSNEKRKGALHIIDAEAGKSFMLVDNMDLIQQHRFYLNNGDTEQQMDAISSLVSMQNNAAIDVLSESLDIQAGFFREDIIDALGDTRSSYAVKILKKYIKHPEKDIRERVVHALRKIGGHESVKILEVALHDSVASIRQEAVYALADVASEADRHLISGMLNDSQSAVREAAIEVIAELNEY